MLNSKLARSSNELRLGSHVLVILGLGTALLTSACGNNPAAQIVTNVTVKTYVQNNDDWVQATATLNTGGFQVAALNIPVMNPTTHVQYGQLTIVPALCSTGCSAYSADLMVAMDITQVSQMPASAPVLPNGTPLPVGGLANATTIAIPVSNTGAYLYFSFGKGVAMLGTAVSFSALDPAGQYAPGIDVFQPIPAGPVEIIAGIYAGSAPKTTGVGLFIDLSGVLNQNPTPAPANSLLHELVASNGGPIKSVLTMNPVQPSQSKVNKLYGKIYELSKEGLTLDTRQ